MDRPTRGRSELNDLPKAVRTLHNRKDHSDEEVKKAQGRAQRRKCCGRKLEKMAVGNGRSAEVVAREAEVVVSSEKKMKGERTKRKWTMERLH